MAAKLKVKKTILDGKEQYVFSILDEKSGTAVIEGEDYTNIKELLEHLAQIGSAITGIAPQDVVVHLSSILEEAAL
jgi:hypothetical protein